MRLILIAITFMMSVGTLSAQNAQPKGITVTGEGIVKVTPDRVKIKARVENKGKTAQEAKSKSDKSMSKVLDFLKKEKISKDDYKTDYINLDKKTDYNTKETHYNAEQSISITLHNIDDYSKIISGLMNSGINRIDGVTFEDSKVEKHQEEARVKAVENAKEKAEDYAKTLNLKVGVAQMIIESAGNMPNPGPMLMRSASYDASENTNIQESPLAVGQIEIIEKVQIRFAIDLE